MNEEPVCEFCGFHPCDCQCYWADKLEEHEAQQREEKLKKPMFTTAFKLWLSMLIIGSLACWMINEMIIGSENGALNLTLFELPYVAVMALLSSFLGSDLWE
jgi:hypothetical protein